jgi:hypothetical protein
MKLPAIQSFVLFVVETDSSLEPDIVEDSNSSRRASPSKATDTLAQNANVSMFCVRLLLDGFIRALP